MKYKAIIFDMDGTIIDSEHIWFMATKTILKKRTIELSQKESDEIFNAVTGAGLSQSSALLKKSFGLKESVEEIAHETSAHVIDLYKEKAVFMGGFTAFHANIVTLQLKVALATNADDEFVGMINDQLNLTHYFGQHIYTINHVNNNGKPNPAIYLHAAQKIEINPEDCIAIEDSAHGIKAAQAAGMFCIGINSSKRIEQVKDADLIINSYHEINLNALLG